MKTNSWSFLLLLASAVPALAAEDLVRSPDGTCGKGTGHTCKLSFYGGCCGANGKCGSNAANCGTGCQTDYGYCSETHLKEKRALSCPSAHGRIFTASNGDQYTVECGIDHFAGDLPFIGYTPSLDACVNKCSENSKCVDVSWVSNGANGACYLKETVGKVSYNYKVWGAKLTKKAPKPVSSIKASSTSAAPPAVVTPSQLCPGFDGQTYTDNCGAKYVVECGIDRPGNDIKWPSYVNSLNDCMNLCSTTKDCVDVAWSKSPWGAGACYLKSKIGTTKKTTSIWGAKQISGCAKPTSSPIASSAKTSSSIASSTKSSSSVLVGPTLISSSSSAIVSSTTSSASKAPVSSSSSSAIVSPIITRSSNVSISSSSVSVFTNSIVSTSKSSSTIETSSSSIVISSSSLSRFSVSANATVSSSLSVSSFSVSANATLTSASTLSTITASANISSSFIPSSTSSIPSNTTTCKNAPTLSASTIPGCVPCQGQPGTDKFCGYDINTDWYKNTPKTCKVVHYNFDITNTTASPDGVERLVMLVNGQMPGPAIKASWGDTVVVKVNNKLQTNGTSIHFHGVRQLNNNMNDGVPSITQCPIAPGSSMTYTWVAENYGTSWYHSHFAIQAWEGVMGPVIIDGPHSAEFDIDLGPFQIQDWSHFTVDSRYDLAQNATPIPGRTDGATFGGPVLLDTGLINGKNIWNGPNQNSTPIGERLEVTLTPNKKHLLRVINSAIQSTYKFYLDGHSFTVIASDFVPITPYTTTVLNINIGQRYDIIVEANQPADNYFLRADNQQACSGTVQAKDIRAIVRYNSASTGIPTSTAYNYTEECVDELLTNLVPVVPLNPTAADITEGALDVVVAANDVQLFKWFLSGTTFFSQYGDPTLLDIFKTNTVPNYSGNLLVELPDAGKMVYVIVESPIPLPHPLHLHGHDFWILASGAGSYDSSVELNLSNPPRRDTALMPAAGFIVLAFQTDNPGAWLMHCHIGWHTSMGFALQFVEMQSQIASSGALNNSCTLTGVCNDWTTYADANGIVVLDSGV